MGFEKYTKKLHELAVESFVKYIDAAKQLENAEKAVREYPLHDKAGLLQQEYFEKAVNAAQARNNAKKEIDAAAANMQETLRKIQDLRGEFFKAVRDYFYPYGKDIDADELKVLQSGIMSPDEYEYMYQVEKNCKNWTMMRIIGKYAGETAAQFEESNPDAAAMLRGICLDANTDRKAMYIDAFDGLVSVYESTVNNPQIIDKWAELTAPSIAALEA